MPKEFELELTPPEPEINGSLTMKVKNMAKEKQKVLVEVNSYLFKLKNATAKKWPLYQIYDVVEPGKSLRFKITVVKSLPKHGFANEIYDDVELLAKPEGVLRITHAHSFYTLNTDQDWGFDKAEDNDRIIHYNRWPFCEIRFAPFDEMDLVCEKETKSIKKMREQLKRKEDPKSGCSIM